jgi:hypothetical protein
MTLDEINQTLTKLFNTSVTSLAPGSWQVEAQDLRLLVLLSEDLEQSWLRVLVPIAPATEAEPFLEQFLVANFDATQAVRYALHQNVLWGVFHHSRTSLTETDLIAAIQQLIHLYERGLDDCFNQLVEARVRQIVAIAKQQGQTLESTMQTLERFYEEGVMGSLNNDAQMREETLAAWRWQMERLWNEIDS